MRPAPIHDAVTAVFVHDREVFVVRRHRAMTAFPGYCAFPGGKLEKSDTNARFDGGTLSDHSPRLVRGLARELREELGFNFFAAWRDGLIEGLHCLGEVTTPAFAPVRFRTWFYRVDLAERPDFTPDRREFEAAEWARPGALVRQYRRGRLLLVPPTLATLRALVADPAARTVRKLDPGFRDDEIPMVEPLGGVRLLMVPSNTLPPAQATNCLHVGDPGSPGLRVDPSPRDEATYGRLKAQAAELGVDRILLTHHHADHREHANRLARELDVPMLMSSYTWDRLRRLDGGKWFSGVRALRIKEGDEVTHWQGESVQVLAVPGHDRGQLALMPESRAWCLVGDLIQGIGTVVIAPPEGDMATYFDTMERVIGLRPRVVIPSHGGAMGSVHRLQAALDHRRSREQQILEGLAAGQDEQALLASLYGDIDQRLLPLALINIRGHVQKLEQEGRRPAPPDNRNAHA